MTATTVGLVEPTPADVRSALEDVLVPRLLNLLTARQAGHCMRVTELEADLALRLVNGSGQLLCRAPWCVCWPPMSRSERTPQGRW